jgi:hypothetical protein
MSDVSGQMRVDPLDPLNQCSIFTWMLDHPGLYSTRIRRMKRMNADLTSDV